MEPSAGIMSVAPINNGIGKNVAESSIAIKTARPGDLETADAAKRGHKCKRSEGINMEPERKFLCTAHTLPGHVVDPDMDQSDTSDSDAITNHEEEPEPKLLSSDQLGTLKTATWQQKQNEQYEAGLIAPDKVHLADF